RCEVSKTPATAPSLRTRAMLLTGPGHGPDSPVPKQRSDMEPSEFEHTTTLAASGEPSQMIPLRRRDFLAMATAGAAAASPLAALAAESSPFPNGFLWGAATAAHQVEGNNINS